MTQAIREGVHDLSLAEYLADPAPVPSLTAGIAGLLLDRSPAHAWWKYREDKASARRDGAIGTVFHAMFLGKGGDYRIIDHPDYRTKAAREARDEALDAGLTPITEADAETAHKMCEHAAMQLERHGIGNFTNEPGAAEQTLLWQEGDVWCRACVDWLPVMSGPLAYIINLKTTTCAEPDWWQRNALRCGYDLSEAHYVRGIRQTLGIEVRELFVVVENKPPYALSVNMLPVGALHMAERKRAYAVERWGACLASGSWPAYPSKICTLAETPAYHEAQFTERELSGAYDPEMLDNLIEMVAPR